MSIRCGMHRSGMLLEARRGLLLLGIDIAFGIAETTQRRGVRVALGTPCYHPLHAHFDYPQTLSRIGNRIESTRCSPRVMTH